jgi:hypothetical protein
MDGSKQSSLTSVISAGVCNPQELLAFVEQFDGCVVFGAGVKENVGIRKTSLSLESSNWPKLSLMEMLKLCRVPQTLDPAVCGARLQWGKGDIRKWARESSF